MVGNGVFPIPSIYGGGCQICPYRACIEGISLVTSDFLDGDPSGELKGRSHVEWGRGSSAL